MIRLNLLKSLQTPLPNQQHARARRAESIEPPREPRATKGIVWILASIAAVALVGASLYLAVHALKHRSASTEIAGSVPNSEGTPGTGNSGQLLATTDTTPPTVSSDSLDYPPVGDSMDEGSPSVSQETAPPPPPAAATAPAAAATQSPAPAPAVAPASSASAGVENIAFQNFTSRHILKDLEAASPPGVGFTSVVFTPPQEFSVSGVASTNADLQNFQNAMTALPGAALQPGQIRSAGAARIFKFSGQVQYPGSTGSSQNRILSGPQLAMALQRFQSAAQSQNIPLPAPQLRDSASTGGVRQFLYHVEARCDYVQLEGLLDKLLAGHSGIGIQRLELDARGQETMVVSLDLIAYVK